MFNAILHVLSMALTVIHCLGIVAAGIAFVCERGKIRDLRARR
jgi:hypothetical protein